jgi:uncharacterized protein YjiS (DUF1127 family)
MTNRLRQYTPIDHAGLTFDCGVSIRLLGRDDYIVRAHAFEVDTRPSQATGRGRRKLLAVFSRMAETLVLWRRRYLTRRHLYRLDRQGLADIGIDPIEQDRETGKPFWKS